MKNILLTTILFAALSCNAQTQIISRYDNTSTLGEINNGYYKDVNDFLNQFEGTWQFTTTTDTLTVAFVKKMKMKIQDGNRIYFADYLVGEFRYVENGVEKTNTLSNLLVNKLSPYDYNLYSSAKLGKKNPPKCDECPENVEQLMITFDEPANDDDMLAADFVIRREVDAGIERIKVQFVLMTGPIGFKKGSDLVPSTATKHSIPYGNYTMIKQ